MDLAEGVRVKDWTSEALAQVKHKVTLSTVEVGEVVALYHRNSRAELYGQRFIYMCEDEVYVYDSNGALVDDPSNGTPEGIQPLHGEGGFLDNVKKYNYQFPTQDDVMEVGATPALAAAVAVAIQSAASSPKAAQLPSAHGAHLTAAAHSPETLLLAAAPDATEEVGSGDGTADASAIGDAAAWLVSFSSDTVGEVEVGRAPIPSHPIPPHPTPSQPIPPHPTQSQPNPTQPHLNPTSSRPAPPLPTSTPSNPTPSHPFPFRFIPPDPPTTRHPCFTRALPRHPCFTRALPRHPCPSCVQRDPKQGARSRRSRAGRLPAHLQAFCGQEEVLLPIPTLNNISSKFTFAN